MIEATPRSSSYSARWHKLSLQTQVRTSFGISTVVALLAVFFIALGVSSDASGKIKVSARAALTAQTERNMQSVSQQAAETVARFLDNLEGSVGILEQATLDLVNDYPTNFDSADNVPFVDASSGALRYPLQVPPAVSDVSSEWAAAYMIDSVKATSDPSGVAELAPGRDFVRMYVKRTLLLLYTTRVATTTLACWCCFCRCYTRLEVLRLLRPRAGAASAGATVHDY
jgi:hypothetical protein